MAIVRSLRPSLGVLLTLLVMVTGLTASTLSVATADPPHPIPGQKGDWRGPSGRVVVPKSLPSRARGVMLFDCEAAGPGGKCGTLRVPLDRTHPRRASVRLFFLYYRHRRPGPSREAIMMSEGGPGASVTNDEFGRGLYREIFDPLLETRDLIMLDQRGVGNSQAIDCRPLQNRPDFRRPGILDRTARCARQLGRRATMYGSGDVALDMEAVRRALHIRRLDLFGASYSAQDVQSYALRFPERVRVAVLDSPISISVFGRGIFDDFYTDGARELSDLVDRVCGRSRSCSAARPNAHRALAWLARRLRRAPVTGSAYDSTGRYRQVRITETSLAWSIVQSGDFNLTALSEVAAAAVALKSGDARPLLRLGVEARALEEAQSGPEPAESFSQGDNAARFCTDVSDRVPWNAHSSVPARRRQWDRRVAALPRNRFGAFSKAAWLTRPESAIGPDPCIVWPAARRSTPAAVPARARLSARVPTLILAGDLDRSLTEDSQRALHRIWPGSKYLVIRNAQHGTLYTARDCAAPMVVRFIARQETGPASCARTNPRRYSYPAVGRFARTAGSTVPATSSRGDRSTVLDRRVATAATAAVSDAFRRGYILGAPHGAGLRGGGFDLSFGDERATADLKNSRFARDVAVSGPSHYVYASQRIEAQVDVAGPGAEDGTLRIRGVWFGFGPRTTVFRVTGTIGGRHVSVTVPAS